MALTIDDAEIILGMIARDDNQMIERHGLGKIRRELRQFNREITGHYRRRQKIYRLPRERPG